MAQGAKKFKAVDPRAYLRPSCHDSRLCIPSRNFDEMPEHWDFGETVNWAQSR